MVKRGQERVDMTKEQLETYKNTYDRYDGIPSNEFDNICDELIKYKDLEEEIGCPLEVRCKVVKNTSIFAELGYRKISNEWLVGEISSDGFICWQKYAIRRYFWKDYKKTWWLKENKEE